MNEEDLKVGLENFRHAVLEKDATLSGRIDGYILQAIVQAMRNVLVRQENNMGRVIEAEIYEETLQYLQNLLAVPGALQKVRGFEKK